MDRTELRTGENGGLPSRIGIQLLVTVGGVAALSWEALWQLQSSLALGVSTLGTAIVLAATMGGMTLGALAGGRLLRARDPLRPLRVYGCLELAIGVSGLLMLPGFRLLEGLDSRLYAIAPGVTPYFHALSIVLLLGPPTVAMGATVPLFQRVARRYGSSIAVLYGLNTAGASAGVLLFAFVLLPALGVRTTVLVVAGLNFVVFAIAWAIRPAPAAEPAPEAHSGHRSAAPSLTLAVARVVAFGTGFATFGLEVAWFRSLRAAFQSMTDSFAIMLAAVLIPLAAGARLVPWLRRRRVPPGALLALGGVLVLVATPIVERMDLLLPPGSQLAYPRLLALRFGLALAVLAPGILCLATALPWCLEEFPEAGQTGRLYGLNTLGAVAGSLLAAWVLLPGFGFAQTAWLLGMTIVALGSLASPVRLRAPIAVGGIAAFAVAFTSSSGVGRDRLQGIAELGRYEILAHAEGPDATISVFALTSGRRQLLIDGFLASTDSPTATYMRWMGSLPVLLHPDPERALVIGFGAGQTTAAVHAEGARNIEVVELNRRVLEMAPFFVSNHGVLAKENVRAAVMDGRAWLRRNPRLYDVITLEPMPPHFAGMNSLYSREFYELLARRLRPGGVAAAYLPTHLLDLGHAASVAATFRDVFPESVLWLDPQGQAGILLGRRAGDGPREAAPFGSDWPGFRRDDRERPLSHEEIRAALVLDRSELARFAAQGSLITDDNQMLAYQHRRRIQNARHTLARTQRNLQAIAAITGRYPDRKPPPRDSDFVPQ